MRMFVLSEFINGEQVKWLQENLNKSWIESGFTADDPTW